MHIFNLIKSSYTLNPWCSTSGDIAIFGGLEQWNGWTGLEWNGMTGGVVQQHKAITCSKLTGVSKHWWHTLQMGNCKCWTLDCTVDICGALPLFVMMHANSSPRVQLRWFFESSPVLAGKWKNASSFLVIPTMKWKVTLPFWFLPQPSYHHPWTCWWR